MARARGTGGGPGSAAGSGLGGSRGASADRPPLPRAHLEPPPQFPPPPPPPAGGALPRGRRSLPGAPPLLSGAPSLVLLSHRGRCAALGGGEEASGAALAAESRGGRCKMADEGTVCSFVFKKRGLAAGRGRRKRPSSDQEQGEGLAGARGRPRKGAGSRAVAIPWGGEGGPGATPERCPHTDGARCPPQPYRCPCGGGGEGLFPGRATALGGSAGLPHLPVGFPSPQRREAASRACAGAEVLLPGAPLPLGFTSQRAAVRRAARWCGRSGGGRLPTP